MGRMSMVFLRGGAEHCSGFWVILITALHFPPSAPKIVGLGNVDKFQPSPDFKGIKTQARRR